MTKLLTSLFLCITIVSAAQQFNAETADAYFARAMTEYNQPGMAIAVVKDGQVVLNKGYGKRNMSRPELVTSNTVFQLASLSKAFTAAAIGMLADEGKLKWEDRVIDHLPFFKLYDPYVTREMTVRDLLCHRNGYLTFDGDLLWYATSYDRREILRRFANLSPKHGFRQKYGYSNIMFIAAAVLIEEKTGKTWETFIRERIFTPLGMTSSFSVMKPFLEHNNIAFPHVKGKPEPHIDYNNAAGAVGVNSSLNDLIKWVNLWLNKGKVNNKVILSENTVREILAAQTPQAVSSRHEQNGTHFRAAACGWMVQDLHGVKMAHHSGGLPGFILNIAMVPEKQLAVIVLTNGETNLPFAATNYVLESFLTEHPKDWVAEYLVFQKAGDLEKKTIDLPSSPGTPVLENTALAGTYEDKEYGLATIRLEGEWCELVLEPTKTLFASRLEFLDKTTYRIRFNDPFLPDGKVIFQLNSSGQVSSFTIDLPNPDFNFFNLKFEKIK